MFGLRQKLISLSTVLEEMCHFTSANSVHVLLFRSVVLYIKRNLNTKNVFRNF